MPRTFKRSEAAALSGLSLDQFRTFDQRRQLPSSDATPEAELDGREWRRFTFADVLAVSAFAALQVRMGLAAGVRVESATRLAANIDFSPVLTREGAGPDHWCGYVGVPIEAAPDGFEGGWFVAGSIVEVAAQLARAEAERGLRWPAQRVILLNLTEVHASVLQRAAAAEIELG